MKTNLINAEETQVVYQEMTVANPKNLKRRMKLRFLVDTGSSGCAIPSEVAKRLRLQCVGEGLVQLADGSGVPARVAYLYMRINNEHVFTLVSYNGCETPLLGFDVMHVLGLQVDAEKKRLLKPLRRFTLKKLVFGRRWISNRRRRQGGLNNWCKMVIILIF